MPDRDPHPPRSSRATTLADARLHRWLLARAPDTGTRWLVTALAAVTTIAGCTGTTSVVDDGGPIQLTRLVTMGDGDGAGMLGAFPVPSGRTRDGFYLVADESAEGTIPVFDSTGTFVRAISRSGAGPGEYRSVDRVLVLDTDSILVFDGRLRRVSILAADQSHIRTFPVPIHLFDLAASASGHLIGSSAVPSRDSALIVLDLDGTVHATFGSSFGDDPIPMPHLLAADSVGFWSARWGGPVVITRYASNGEEIGTLRPPSTWTTAAQNGPVTPTQPPGSQLRGLWVNGDQLWLLGSIADPDWVRGLGDETPGEGGVPTYQIVDRDRVYDSIIEVIDVRTGVILASQRFDHEFRLVPFSGAVARLAETEREGMRVEIYSVSMRESGRRP